MENREVPISANWYKLTCTLTYQIKARLKDSLESCYLTLQYHCQLTPTNILGIYYENEVRSKN